MAKSNPDMKNLLQEHTVSAKFYNKDDVVQGSIAREFDIRRVRSKELVSQDVLRTPIVNDAGQQVRHQIRISLIEKIIEESFSLEEENKLKLQNAILALKEGDERKYNEIKDQLSQEVNDKILVAEGDFKARFQAGDKQAIDLYESALPGLKIMSEGFLSLWYEYAHQNVFFQAAMLQIASIVTTFMANKGELRPGYTCDIEFRVLFGDVHPYETVTIEMTAKLRFSKTMDSVPLSKQVADDDLAAEVILGGTRTFTMNEEGDINLVSTTFAEPIITGNKALKENYSAALAEDIKKDVQYISAEESKKDLFLLEIEKCDKILGDYSLFSNLYKKKGDNTSEEVSKIASKVIGLRNELQCIKGVSEKGEQSIHDIKDLITIATYEMRELGKKLSEDPEIEWNESPSGKIPCEIYESTPVVLEENYKEANRKFLLRELPEKIEKTKKDIRTNADALKKNKKQYDVLEELKKYLDSPKKSTSFLNLFGSSKESDSPEALKDIDRFIMNEKGRLLKNQNANQQPEEIAKELQKLEENKKAICTLEARKAMVEKKMNANRTQYAKLLSEKEQLDRRMEKAEEQMHLLQKENSNHAGAGKSEEENKYKMEDEVIIEISEEESAPSQKNDSLYSGSQSTAVSGSLTDGHKSEKDKLDENVVVEVSQIVPIVFENEQLIEVGSEVVDPNKKYEEARSYYEKCLEAYEKQVVEPALNNEALANNKFNINEDPVIKSSREFLKAADSAVKQGYVNKNELTPIFEFQACQLHDCMQTIGHKPPVKPKSLQQFQPDENTCTQAINKLAKSGKRSLAAKAFTAVAVLLGVAAVAVTALTVIALFPPAVAVIGPVASILGPTMLTATTAAIAAVGSVGSAAIGFKIEEIHQENAEKACAKIKATATSAKDEVKAEVEKNSNNVSPEVSRRSAEISALRGLSIFNSLNAGARRETSDVELRPDPIDTSVYRQTVPTPS